MNHRTTLLGIPANFKRLPCRKKPARREAAVASIFLPCGLRSAKVGSIDTIKGVFCISERVPIALDQTGDLFEGRTTTGMTINLRGKVNSDNIAACHPLSSLHSH